MDAADVLALLDGVQAAAADSEPEAEAAEAQPRSAADILRLLDDPLAPGRPLVAHLSRPSGFGVKTHTPRLCILYENIDNAFNNVGNEVIDIFLLQHTRHKNL